MNFATQLLEKSNVFSQAGAASLTPRDHRINNNRYANTKSGVTSAKIGAQIGSRLYGKKLADEFKNAGIDSKQFGQYMAGRIAANKSKAGKAAQQIYAKNIGHKAYGEFVSDISYADQLIRQYCD